MSVWRLQFEVVNDWLALNLGVQLRGKLGPIVVSIEFSPVVRIAPIKDIKLHRRLHLGTTFELNLTKEL